MRKCRFCRQEIPKRKDCTDPIQSGGFCGVKCLAEHGRQKRIEQEQRAERKRQQQRKERIKTKADHAKEAQAVFNAWVRERDKGLPCISCDRPDGDTHQRHASHYRSRGACPELAFEPLNVHASCAQCNSMKSGNIIEYRIRLAKKIGDDALEWLEGPHDPRKYTIDELKEIKATYRRKLRELKSSQ